MSLRYTAVVACLAGLVPLLAEVRAAAPAFEWIARAETIVSSPGSQGDIARQVLGNRLRHTFVDEATVTVRELSANEWATVKTFRHQIRGRRHPLVAQSFDTASTYLWTYDRELRLFAFAEDGRSTLLFSSQDERLAPLMNSQGAGRVSGDAANGFWVTNAFLGSALFIEPGTWAIREVPALQGASSDRGLRRGFSAAELGTEGSLWVIEPDSKDIVRRNARGEELARVRWPFDARAPSRMVRVSDGWLAPSAGGVLVSSETGLELASIGNDGALRWRLAVCASEINTQCPRQARQRGELSGVSRAVADAQGNAWVMDPPTQDAFYFNGVGTAVRKSGSPPPCAQTSSARTPLGSQSVVPCIGRSERLVRSAAGRYLLYSVEPEGMFVEHVMEVTGGAPTQIKFKKLDIPAADLPLAERQAILQSRYDSRVWAGGSHELGIPTSRGIATASRMMEGRLSSPGAIRTPEDEKLAALIEPRRWQVGPGSHSMARLGDDGVVIKDLRVPPTQLALFDMRKGQLRQGIAVRGLPAATGPDREKSSFEYVFNDDRDRLYLLRQWSGEVYSIDKTFTAQRIGRLPKDDTCACARLSAAANTPDGRLVLATDDGVFVQRGDAFVRVAAPQKVLQLVVLNDKEALVIASAGLAKIKLSSQ